MKTSIVTASSFCVLFFSSCGVVEVEDGADGEGPYPIWCERTQTETTDGVTTKKTWVSEFDEQGRLSAFKYTTIEIDQYGVEDVSSCTDWWVAYDENGRAIEWRRRGCNNTGSGSSWKMEYDDRGYLSLIQYREGGENPYEYDSRLTWEDGKLVRMDMDDFDEESEDLFLTVGYGENGRLESSVLTRYYDDGTVHETTRSYMYGEDEWRPERKKSESRGDVSLFDFSYNNSGVLAQTFVHSISKTTEYEYYNDVNVKKVSSWVCAGEDDCRPTIYQFDYSCW